MRCFSESIFQMSVQNVSAQEKRFKRCTTGDKKGRRVGLKDLETHRGLACRESLGRDRQTPNHHSVSKLLDLDRDYCLAPAALP